MEQMKNQTEIERIERNTRLMTNWCQDMNEDGATVCLVISNKGQMMQLLTHFEHELVIDIIEDTLKMLKGSGYDLTRPIDPKKN